MRLHDASLAWASVDPLALEVGVAHVTAYSSIVPS
jgi:hypothetical protein